MTDSDLTALATGLLVFVGIAQIIILFVQNKQARVSLITEYRHVWKNCKNDWGNVIFVGRNPDEYYQVVDENTIVELKEKVGHHRLDRPTIWAQDSIQTVCNIMAEVSSRILQGQLRISDAYSIFGTELLRHSRPLRNLLDTEYVDTYSHSNQNSPHTFIRREMQDWLIYHDGIRRRCLILIDLLWAEATRLEDLPPNDIKSAATAKSKTGKQNKKRVYKEVLRLNGIKKIMHAFRMRQYLKYSQFSSFWNLKGMKKSRFKELEKNWTKRLLRE